jgi:hypothetical protein
LLFAIKEDLQEENISPGRQFDHLKVGKPQFQMRPTRIVVPEREKHDPVIQYENLDLSNGRNSFASGQSNDEFNKIN